MDLTENSCLLLIGHIASDNICRRPILRKTCALARITVDTKETIRHFEYCLNEQCTALTEDQYLYSPSQQSPLLLQHIDYFLFVSCLYPCDMLISHCFVWRKFVVNFLSESSLLSISHARTDVKHVNIAYLTSGLIPISWYWE